MNSYGISKVRSRGLRNWIWMNGGAARARRSAGVAERIGSVVNFLEIRVLFIVLFFRIFFQFYEYQRTLFLQFINSEKATKFCQISTLDLSYVVTVKHTVEISQNFVAFSEWMNFKVQAFSEHKTLIRNSLSTLNCQTFRCPCNAHWFLSGLE